MPIGLDAALYRLLHHRSYRQAFLSGDTARLDLAEEDLAQLRTIDRDELAALAKQICARLLRGDLEVDGGLKKAFPRCFRALSALGREPLEVMYRFMESPAFDGYGDANYGRPGMCIEEAFHRFLSGDAGFLSAASHHAALLDHELLTAMTGILHANRRPGFAVPEELFRGNGVARYTFRGVPREIALLLDERAGAAPATDRGEVLFVYAVGRDRPLRGPIHPAIAALLSLGTRDAIDAGAGALASRWGMTAAELGALADRLDALGLVG